MKQLYKILFSPLTMTVLLLLFGMAMAGGTFLENYYDTSTAKLLVYNSTWFEILMLWLVILFVINIKTYNLTRREKWPILLFHLAFIFIFIGGVITRYTGFEGIMPIEEGETTNKIISDLTYFKLVISDGKETRNYEKHPYLMSYLNAKNTKWPFKRTFNRSYQFKNKDISLKTLDYVPMARDSVHNTEFGKSMLNIVSIGKGSRQSNYILDGQSKNINGTIFSFNNPIQGTVQIMDQNESFVVNFPINGQYMSMKGQQVGVVTDPDLLVKNSGEIYANEHFTLNHRTLYSVNNTNFIIPEKVIKGEIVHYSGDKNNLKDKDLLDVIQVEVSSGNQKDTILIKGGKGVTELSKSIKINGLDVSLGFGSRIFLTDFYVRCDDFILDRYPGSTNPSSYESNITVIDGNMEKKHHIYMNNVLDYRGYRFFQASYFPDESGTILSVNADREGTILTYIGYFLLFIGMFFTLFTKKSHFQKLNNSLKKLQIKKIHKKKIILSILLSLGLGMAPSFAQNDRIESYDEMVSEPFKPEPDAQFAKPGELGSNHIIDPVHSGKFGYLLVQDFQGRIKPLNTYTLELLRKIHKKDKFQKGNQKLSAEQWFISMQIDPKYWANKFLISVGEKGGDKLIQETGANPEGYTSYANLVDRNTGKFILERQYNRSFSKKKADQSNYDKAVIEVAERFNIYSSVSFGYYTRIVPVKNDPTHSWRSWIYSSEKGSGQIDMKAYELLTNYFNGVKEGLRTGNWNKAYKSLNNISEYQQMWGKDIIPSKSKIKLEILYNYLKVFFWLLIIYGFLGILLLIFGFAEVFSSGSRYNYIIQISINIMLKLMVIALTIQLIALGVRWFLSGHAPWSNGYEAIIFISAVGVLSALLLYRNRNAFIPAAGALVAMIMMGFAHGGSMLDPQITPLEPVLQSYWLMIHVGIITSSYGFFGLSAILSAITLILFVAKPTSKIGHSIKELTIVNEMALTIGIFALTIGTFLGGIWANESWGRYWSWDPKETWAFISIIIYAVVLHLRFVPKLKGSLTYNIISLWAIWSIIFTYFGVNYYLTGLHSYAAGDPIPIPDWIYMTIAGMLVLSMVAYFKTKSHYKRRARKVLAINDL